MQASWSSAAGRRSTLQRTEKATLTDRTTNLLFPNGTVYLLDLPSAALECHAGLITYRFSRAVLAQPALIMLLPGISADVVTSIGIGMLR